MRTPKILLTAGLLLAACGPLTHEGQLQALDDQIALERKKQELERLKAQNQPSPSPTPTAAPDDPAPFAGNQPPRLTRLEARLTTSVKPNDTVEVVAAASDPDGDPIEYSWSSVYDGLSATRGEKVVWFPKGQQLAGRTNLITLQVNDKKGGTSTGTLNVYVQSDGTLLVRENLAAQPILLSLEISRPEVGQLRFKAMAVDPAGGTVRYKWSASQGLLGSNSTDTTTWSAAGSETGEVKIQLVMSNGDGTAQNQLEYRFVRNADGSLSGDFRTIRGAAPIAAPSSDTPGTAGGQRIQGTAYGLRGSDLVSISLATGQQLRLASAPGGANQMLSDGQDSLYLLGNGLSVMSFSRLDVQPLSLASPPITDLRKLFMLQGQACVVAGSANSYQAYQLPSGKALALKNSEWLLLGPVSSQGLVASLSGKTVQISDPGRGVQQDWLDLTFNEAAMAWNPAGTRLAVAAGNQLHVLGTDGSKAVKPLKSAPSQMFWLNDRTLLGLQGRPGNYQALVIDPDTGNASPLQGPVAEALKALTVIQPG